MPLSNANVDYKKMLLELQEQYDNQFLADLFNVGIRSIQNYTKEENPTNPNETTARLIRESFAKHQIGEKLTLPNDFPKVNTYQDEYIDLLKEQIADLKRQLKEKDDEIKVLFKDFNSYFVELKQSARITAGYAKAVFQGFAPHRSKTEKSPLDQMKEEMGTLYAEAMAESS